VPIRKGQEKASVRVDTGELIVTRTFTRKGESDYTTEIRVENAEGARFPTPQKMLDALLGELAFDPLAFARMEPKHQFEALKRFVPGVDFAAIAAADRGDRERRTELGRIAKQERAAAELITYPSGTSNKYIDETALVGELEKAGTQNAELEQRVANRRRAADQIDVHERKAAEVRLRIADLKRQVEQLEGIATGEDQSAWSLKAKLEGAEPLPPAVDTTQIRERIEAARATNAHVRKFQERKTHETKAKQLDEQIEALTAKIEQRQTDKQAAIAASEMPVPGLGFGEDCILLNGLPFEQGSDAEQLRTSVAIAMALNPKLRVIRVRDGSLLDEDGLNLLAEMAEKADMQVWIERVDSVGKIGFVLEDGHLRAAAADPAA
jgi:hypothetical protein